jgi:hypothetical protein
MSDDAALLDNHLAFLAAHRGEVRRSAAGIEVVGDPASVTLVLRSGPVFGVYAVATKPA